MTAIKPEIESFEQIVTQEEFPIPCESRWHKGDFPAIWIIHRKSEWCCCSARQPLTFWCDSCLQGVLQHPGGRWWKCTCGHLFYGPIREEVAWYEPIDRAS